MYRTLLLPRERTTGPREGDVFTTDDDDIVAKNQA
jgi:hypothetical protein